MYDKVFTCLSEMRILLVFHEANATEFILFLLFLKIICGFGDRTQNLVLAKQEIYYHWATSKPSIEFKR